MATLKGLESLLIDNEEYLMVRILTYAKNLEYTQYSSTLEAAWRLSIEGLSMSFIKTLKASDQKPKIGPHLAKSPLTEFAIKEASVHRKRGVTIGMFLGLIKYYRQSYMDLCDEKSSMEQAKIYKDFLLWCFDTIEVAFCHEWGKVDNAELIEELQTTNRYMTNEKNAYLTVFESLNDPVFMVNFSREVINLNHAANLFIEGEVAKPGRAYYANVKEDLIDTTDKKSIYEVLPWVPKEMLEPSGNHRFKTSSLTVTLAQEVKHYEVIVGNMLDISEKFTASVITLRDLTAHKNTELQLIDTLNSRNQFFSIIAHDVRSPLMGIISLSKMLSEEWNKTSEEDKESMASIIYESSALLDKLINNLLDWSRTQAGSIKFNPSHYSIQETVTDLFKLYEGVANIKNIKLVSEVDPSVIIFADKDMISTVLRNLLSNAVKFTNEDGEVFVQYRQAERVHFICVKDTGVGIKQSNLESLFKEDSKIQSRGTHNESGTGLGLLLSFELVKRHGGKISVQSREGQGAEFCIELPFQQNACSNPQNKLL